MRIFWSLIAVLVLATAGLIVARRLPSTPPPASKAPAELPAPVQPPIPQNAPAMPAAPDPVAPAPAAGSSTAAAAPTETRPLTAPAPTAPAEQARPDASPHLQPPPAPSPAEATPTPPESTAPGHSAPASPDAPSTPKPDEAVTPAKSSSPEAPPAPESATRQPPASTPSASPGTAADPSLPHAAASADQAATTPSATTAPSRGPKPRATATPEAIAAAESAKGPPSLVQQADGTTLVDQRFVMKGDGTREHPYEVTWEQLMSAQETYKPRLGLKVIPGRLSMISDKWVKVSGYVAFPVMAQGPDEMLMMLNQWDGCCIGVPPTPYDAIEVKLAKPAEGETRLLVMGTVTGKLKVDPYLVKDWLVSLYIMDEAEVVKQSGTPMRDATKPQEHLAP